MRLEDICGAQRSNPIFQHAPALAMYDPNRQIGRITLPGSDVIKRVICKKIRPFLQSVVINRVCVVHQKVYNTCPQICV